jgi:hypothetical protein
MSLLPGQFSQNLPLLSRSTSNPVITANTVSTLLTVCNCIVLNKPAQLRAL